MDELDISGKRYISSKRAARENKYHADYMGQLIRSGKIVGSKVGRTWYIEVDSLNAYLGHEYTPPTAAIMQKNYTPNLELAKQVVEKKEPTLPAFEVRQEEMTSPTPGSLTYLSDDEPLLPRVTRPDSVVHIKKPTTVFETSTQKKEVLKENRPNHPQYTNKLIAIAVSIAALVACTGAASISHFLQYNTTVEAANVYTSVHF